MTKVTFRADPELVERVERLDASKSEVMRSALREYLDATEGGPATRETGSLDALVDERIERRVAAALDDDRGDVTGNVALNGERVTDGPSDAGAVSDTDRAGSVAEVSDARTCSQCGEDVDPSHAFCPNCGERASQPACECGAALRTDWAFCPDCGRRTPSADVLER
ncbi:MAG: zinc ribbon domain-containing protein [Halarchaeum sp.]